MQPSFSEFKDAIEEFKPTLVYLAGPSSYEQNKNTGTIGPLQFRGKDGCVERWFNFALNSPSTLRCVLPTDGYQATEALASACKEVETVYVDAAAQDSIGERGSDGRGSRCRPDQLTLRFCSCRVLSLQAPSCKRLAWPTPSCGLRTRQCPRWWPLNSATPCFVRC